MSHSPREGEGACPSGKRQAPSGGKGPGEACWNYKSGRCPRPLRSMDHPYTLPRSYLSVAARGGTARHRPHTPDHCPISGRLGVGQAAFRVLLPSSSLRSAWSGVCTSCACAGPLTGQAGLQNQRPWPAQTLSATHTMPTGHCIPRTATARASTATLPRVVGATPWS